MCRSRSESLLPPICDSVGFLSVTCFFSSSCLTPSLCRREYLSPLLAVAEGFEPGQTRAYVEQQHSANMSGRVVPNHKLTSSVPLFGKPDTNISDEYFVYKKMADRYRVTEVRYTDEGSEMHKTYYMAPYSTDGMKMPLSEWTAMSSKEFSDIKCVDAKRDSITYFPKLYTRACQPIPFSVVHCAVSNYNTEQRRSKEINTKFPHSRKFAQEINMELVAGTFFEKPTGGEGPLIKKQLAFWTVRETIDEQLVMSVQYPDSQTEVGYETVETPRSREVCTKKILEIAKTLHDVGDIAAEIIERAKEIVNNRF